MDVVNPVSSAYHRPWKPGIALFGVENRLGGWTSGLPHFSGEIILSWVMITPRLNGQHQRDKMIVLQVLYPSQFALSRDLVTETGHLLHCPRQQDCARGDRVRLSPSAWHWRRLLRHSGRCGGRRQKPLKRGRSVPADGKRYFHSGKPGSFTDLAGLASWFVIVLTACCGLGHAGRRPPRGPQQQRGAGRSGSGPTSSSSAASPTDCSEWRPLFALPQLGAYLVRGHSRRSRRRSDLSRNN